MTFSVGRAAATMAVQIAAPIAIKTMNNSALLVFISVPLSKLCLHDRKLNDLVMSVANLGFHIAKAQAFVWRSRIPGDWRASGHRAGSGERKDQRFRRVMRNVPGHKMVLL